MKQVYVASALTMLFLVGGLTIFFNISNQKEALAAVNGSYRTKTSGNWNTVSVWETWSNPSWIAATTPPSSSDKSINIQSGHTVTITSNVIADELTVDQGGTLILNGSTLTINNGTGTDMVVHGILDMGANIINGAGSFTITSNNATLKIGSTAGITSSGATGNVQCTGSRNFNSSVNYMYNGTTTQVTGSGLPATLKNLTFDNTAGVTLSASVQANGTLYLTNGKVHTGGFELYLNGSASDLIGHSNSNYVSGNFRRAISASGSYDFPVGTSTNNEMMNLNLTGISGPSTLLVAFVNANPINASYPLTGVAVAGTPINEMLNYGYWTLTPNNPITGGTYTATFSQRGHTNGVSNPQAYTVLTRDNSGSNWVSTNGTHNNNTQANDGTVVSTARAGLSTRFDFGIGFSSGGSLPIKLIYFTAKLNGSIVNFDWATAAEVNNNFFTVERSTNGENFEPLLTKPGAGNSTINLYYNAVDESPLNGYSYYRLKQTDYDGQYTYSDIATVKNGESAIGDEQNIEIKTVSPNPFVDNFKVSFFSKNAAVVNFSLMSSSGQLVAQEKIQAEEGINTYEFTDRSNLRKGIYYLTIFYNEQKTIRNIIKN